MDPNKFCNSKHPKHKLHYVHELGNADHQKALAEKEHGIYLPIFLYSEKTRGLKIENSSNQT